MKQGPLARGWGVAKQHTKQLERRGGARRGDHRAPRGAADSRDVGTGASRVALVGNTMRTA
jgi:hypothetical protein